jgi:hypothetical protein
MVQDNRAATPQPPGLGRVDDDGEPNTWHDRRGVLWISHVCPLLSETDFLFSRRMWWTTGLEPGSKAPWTARHQAVTGCSRVLQRTSVTSPRAAGGVGTEGFGRSHAVQLPHFQRHRVCDWSVDDRAGGQVLSLVPVPGKWGRAKDCDATVSPP